MSDDDKRHVRTLEDGYPAPTVDVEIETMQDWDIGHQIKFQKRPVLITTKTRLIGMGHGHREGNIVYGLAFLDREPTV